MLLTLLTGCLVRPGKDDSVELRVHIAGQGTVKITTESLGLLGEGWTVRRDSEVVLHAVPEPGWQLAKWQGPDGEDVKPRGNDKWSIHMNEAKHIEAVFQEAVLKPITITGSVSIEHEFPWAAEDTQGSRGRSAPKEQNLSTQAINDVAIDEVILRFDASVSIQERDQFLTESGYEVLDTIDVLNAVLVKYQPIALQSTPDEMPPIVYMEQNRSMAALATRTPSDPLYDQQWNYRQIRLPQAWSITTGDDRIRIAVVDSGIDHNHPDLVGQVDITTGYNFVSGNSNAMDDHWHGTHVAGIIGAKTNNSQGIAGVMWDVSLVPIKVLDENGDGSWWSVSKGILYGAGLLDDPKNPYPADIINISLGSTSPSSLLEDAVTKASDQGAILVAAAGNYNQPEVLYPAHFPQTIAVGAVDYNFPLEPRRAPYSNYGTGLNFMAPGGDHLQDSDQNGSVDGIISTMTYYDYRMAQGTSMAAPHISGIIGLMLAAGVPHYDVQDVLQRTAMKLSQEDYDLEYGYGLVNAYWAVSDVKEIKIIMGTKEKNTIVPMAQTTIPNLTGGDFSIRTYTSDTDGEFQIFAWIDVNRNSKVDAGDYLAESIYFNPGGTKSLQMNELMLREVTQDF